MQDYIEELLEASYVVDDGDVTYADSNEDDGGDYIDECECF